MPIVGRDISVTNHGLFLIAIAVSTAIHVYKAHITMKKQPLIYHVLARHPVNKSISCTQETSLVLCVPTSIIT